MPTTYGWIITLGVDAQRMAILCGAYNSLIFDFLLRTALSQPSIPRGTFEQVALPPPSRYSDSDAGFIVPRVLELTYTAHDLAPWARDLGYNGPHFTSTRSVVPCSAPNWTLTTPVSMASPRRTALHPRPCRCHGRGLPSETFRVLKNNELREFGEYHYPPPGSGGVGCDGGQAASCGSGAETCSAGFSKTCLCQGRDSRVSSRKWRAWCATYFCRQGRITMLGCARSSPRNCLRVPHTPRYWPNG